MNRSLLATIGAIGLLAALTVESRLELASQGDVLRKDQASVQRLEQELQVSTGQAVAARADTQASQGQLRMVFAAIAQQEGITPAALQLRLQAYCAAVKC